MSGLGIEEATQLTRRIQLLARAGRNEEVVDLAVLLEETLSQPGISLSSPSNPPDDMRLIHMQEMVATFEMGRQDILRIARSKAIITQELALFTNDQLESIYKEAKNLYEEGLLDSYLNHLSIEEERHMLPPAKPTPSGPRVAYS